MLQVGQFCTCPLENVFSPRTLGLQPSPRTLSIIWGFLPMKSQDVSLPTSHSPHLELRAKTHGHFVRRSGLRLARALGMNPLLVQTCSLSRKAQKGNGRKGWQGPPIINVPRMSPKDTGCFRVRHQPPEAVAPRPPQPSFACPLDDYTCHGGHIFVRCYSSTRT